MIRKILFALIMTTTSSVALAEEASSGNFELEGFFAGTANILDAGNGNLTITYDGVMTMKAVEDGSFGDLTTWHCAGSITALGGKYDNEIGICKWQFPDGDTAFITYVGSGVLGQPASGKGRFIGGTGKYENISGEIAFERQSLQSAKEGYVQSRNRSTGSYSLN